MGFLAEKFMKYLILLLVLLYGCKKDSNNTPYNAPQPVIAIVYSVSKWTNDTLGYGWMKLKYNPPYYYWNGISPDTMRKYSQIMNVTKTVFWIRNAVYDTVWHPLPQADFFVHGDSVLEVNNSLAYRYGNTVKVPSTIYMKCELTYDP